MKRVQQLLTTIGLEADRVKMYNLSAAMAGEFVNAAKTMTEQIYSLGPNPLRHAEGTKLQAES